MPRWRPKSFPQKKSEERQEIHCHACDKWVQFIIDVAMDGNHVLNCPNCNHEHCRVVKDGKITDFIRDQRNGPTYQVPVYYISYTVNSAFDTIYSVTSSTGGSYSDATQVFNWGT
jgi:hypothetical protein